MSVHFNITSRDAEEGRAQCALCREWFPLEDIMGHVRGAHDLDVEVETWPDGSPVIVDQTLEPDDFASGEQNTETRPDGEA